LVNLFDVVCNVATVFFAMIQMYFEDFIRIKYSYYLISL